MFSPPAFLMMSSLFLLWLVLSGHFTPVLLGLGIVSALVSAWLGQRFAQTRDQKQHRTYYPSLFGALMYWLWLLGEIIKANRIVLHTILRADMDIQPSVIKIRTRCQSSLAKTVLANSITLTPGTVTLSVSGSEFLIHTLLHSLAQPEAFADMDRRVALVFDRGVSA